MALTTMKKVFLLFIAVILLAFASAKAEAGQQLGIGVISAKPEKRIKDYEALAHYLGKRLARQGIGKVRVLVARDIEEMFRLIKKGEVDILLESAVAAIELEKCNMMPSLLAWRKGVREYRTLFIVRKDSSIRTLDDLKGKSIVFQDPSSTSAFAIPLVELKKKGLRPASAETGPKTEDGVVFLFAGVALNEAYWVAQGRTDAAAISNNDWDGLPEKVRFGLRIIHETTPILRYVVSLRQDLPAELKQELETILLRMEGNPDGLRALQDASEIRKIEAFSERDLESLDYVRSLLPFLTEVKVQ